MGIGVAIPLLPVVVAVVDGVAEVTMVVGTGVLVAVVVNEVDDGAGELLMKLT